MTGKPLASTPPPNNTGVFVGVSHFTHMPSLNLPFCVNDAISLAHTFVCELNLIPAKRCFLALSGAPTSPAARQKLAALKAKGARVGDSNRATIFREVRMARRISTREQDMIVLSLATHGIEIKGSAYVMPADAMMSMPGQTLLAVADLQNLLHEKVELDGREVRPGKWLVIVDACRKQPGRDVGSGEMTDTFLHAFRTAKGQATLMACDIGQVSMGHGSLQMGVFTHFVVEGLAGKAETDSRGYITLGTLSKYVAENVRRFSREKNPGNPDDKIQSPTFHGPERAREIPLAVGDPRVRQQQCKALLVEAERLFHLGELRSALRTLDELAALDADHKGAASLRKQIDAKLEQQGKQIAILLKAAESLDGALRNKEAATKYKLVLDLDKNNPQALNRLQSVQKRIEQATLLLAEAQQADKQRRNRQALDVLKRIEALDPHNEAAKALTATVQGRINQTEQLLAAARDCFRRFENEASLRTAAEKLAQARKLDSTHAEITMHMAWVQRLQAVATEVAEHSSRLETFATDGGRLWQEYSTTRQEAKAAIETDVPKAIAALEQSAALLPRIAKVGDLIAGARKALADRDRAAARKALTEVLKPELDPEHDEARTLLSRIEAMDAKDQYAKAIEHIVPDRCAEEAPVFWKAAKDGEKTASAAFEAGHYPAAKTAYEAASKAVNTAHRIVQLLSSAEKSKAVGNGTIAEKALEELLELSADNAKAKALLTWVQSRQGAARAKAAYEQASAGISQDALGQDGGSLGQALAQLVQQAQGHLSAERFPQAEAGFVAATAKSAEVLRVVGLMADARRATTKDTALRGLIAVAGVLKIDPNHTGAKQIQAKLRSMFARPTGFTPGSSFTNAAGMDMIYLGPGTFRMGRNGKVLKRLPPAGPAHSVTLTKGFCLGKHEVTNAQWAVFVEATQYTTQAEKDGLSSQHPCPADGSARSVRAIDGATWLDPKYRSHPNPKLADARFAVLPVTCVSQSDAKAFCRWLGEVTGRTYRLPTEAEWEYACRAGSDSEDSPDIKKGDACIAVATSPSPVGSYRANPWGMKDMFGNVSEWVMDTYAPYPKDAAKRVDPLVVDEKDGFPIARGGAWTLRGNYVKWHLRWHYIQKQHRASPSIGFRVAMAP